MTGDFEITVDGLAVAVKKGETILQVALRMGKDIPVFCWHPHIDPVGACRMCLVQVEKIPKLVVACATPAAPNMVVHTHNDVVHKARSGVLEFMLIDHPLDCPTCDKGGECMLQDNVYHYGLDRSRFTETKFRFERDAQSFLDDVPIGPQIIRNMNRCIRCYRCTRFTQEIAGEGDLGIFNRGVHTEIDTLADREVGNLYSGNTVEICPVGALTSEDFRYTARPWVSYRTPSVCNLCPDGCNLTLWNNRRELFRVTSRENKAVDEGWICDRGRYAYAYRESPGRVLEPLAGDGKAWQKTGWPEATHGAAQALRRVLDTHGAGAVGGLVSPLASNETIYLFQRFMRRVLGSNSVDWRVDRKWLGGAERRRRHRAFPRISRPLAALDRTRLIVALGCDLENERPITSLRALKAQRTFGAKLVLANNRPTRLRRKADFELIYAPGSERAFMAGLLFCAQTLPGARALPTDTAAVAAAVRLEDVARITGVPAEQIRRLAEQLAAAESCVVYLGRDIRKSPDQEAIVDLALTLSEVLGFDGGSKALELSAEYSNAIGATLMGAEPEVLPGAIEGQSTPHASTLSALWGGQLPSAGGYDAAEMLEAAVNDRLKALVLLETHPLFHYPDSAWVRRALSHLECVVVLGQFDLGVPGEHYYFLPNSTVHEEGGTFVSGEGRLQYFEAAVKAAGQAQPVRQILGDLAAALGTPWPFSSSQDVYLEMTQAIPVLAGTTHATLRDTEGVLLPLGGQPQDLETLYQGARAALADLTPPFGKGQGSQFLLQTGNIGHHFAHLTHQSAPIMNFAALPYALLHPEDGERLGVTTGQWIELKNDCGKIELLARLSPLVASGMIVVPVHYPQANPNALCQRDATADYVQIRVLADREPELCGARVAEGEVGPWT
jgi:NADH-quinone oxidoreductase chain G